MELYGVAAYPDDTNQHPISCLYKSVLHKEPLETSGELRLYKDEMCSALAGGMPLPGESKLIFIFELPCFQRKNELADTCPHIAVAKRAPESSFDVEYYVGWACTHAQSSTRM
jgi:hypothetical protein